MATCSYGADQMFRIRRLATLSPAPSLLSSLAANELLHYRGRRAGRNVQRSIRCLHRRLPTYTRLQDPQPPLAARSSSTYSSLLRVSRATLEESGTWAPPIRADTPTLPPPSAIPSIYLTNPTGLYQPNALQVLHSDLIAYKASLAAVCETWYKCKHSTEITDISGYTCFRKDRKGRARGGVACYVRGGIECERFWRPPGDV